MKFDFETMIRFIEADSFLKSLWERKPKKSNELQYAQGLFNSHVRNVTWMEQQYSRYLKT